MRENRAKIQPYERLFNRFLYVRSSFGGGVCWGILAGYTLAIGYGLFVLVRLVRRRGPTGPREAALLFAWLTVIYLAVVVALSEVLENGRIRFLTDALVVVLLAALARDAYNRLATQNRLPHDVPERVPDRVGS